MKMKTLSTVADLRGLIATLPDATQIFPSPRTCGGSPVLFVMGRVSEDEDGRRILVLEPRKETR